MGAETNENKTGRYLVILLLLLLVSYWFGSQNHSGQGGSAPAITSRLDSLERDNRDLKAKLDRAAEETSRNLRRIEAAEARASRIEDLAREALAGLQINDRLVEEAGRLSERSERTLRRLLEGTENKDQKP